METNKERHQSNKLSLKIVFNQTRSHIQSNYSIQTKYCE